jgi:AIPR protein
MQAATHKDLRREIADLRERYPKLAEDDLFVLWFLRAFVTDDERQAVQALTGGSGDKSVDAVFVDDSTKTVVIVQAKYRRAIGVGNEKRSDVVGFAHLAAEIGGDSNAFKDYCKGLRPEVEGALAEARNRVAKRGYRLLLHYVTTGRCSKGLMDEAESIARRVEFESSLRVADGKQVLLLLADYLDGVAPPVPSLELKIETGKGGGAGGVLQRYDHETEIESWVFSMTERSVSEMFREAGVRLFARNVRGFLGNTDINRGMEATLTAEPEYFWYYNNGITIICDEAERKIRGGLDILHVTNPQVINGQQTTRTLAQLDGHSSTASVLVRVIRVPRNGDSSERFEKLVSKLVGATNWQNHIFASDLMSNDRRQIEIERQFRKLGYLYLRKRQTRREAARYAYAHHQYFIKKEELAQAVAGCDLDPYVVREGKEGLFEERLYARVFPVGDPLYYLCRYWLMKEVSRAARGFPERAYAKWMVLNFVWSQMGPILRARRAMELFRQSCERQRAEVVGPLNLAIDSVFRAALAFFRWKRGAGEKAQDVSTFFKRRKLAEDFSRYWSSSRNARRPAFRRRLNDVAMTLSEP